VKPYLLLLFVFAFGLAPLHAQPASAEPERVKFQGMLKPFREVRLASRAQGVIAEIQEEGRRLKEGETVLRLEDSMEKLQVEQQRRVLEMRVVEDEAGATLGKSSTISRLEAMEKSLNLEIARIVLAQTEELLARRTVTSPFDGVVTERLRSVGEAVDEFVPVLTIVDIDKLYFEAFLPAALVNAIKEGQSLEIEVPLFPGETFNGVVEMVSPVVNPASSEFKIKVAIDNTSGRLSSGLPASSELIKPPTDG